MSVSGVGDALFAWVHGVAVARVLSFVLLLVFVSALAFVADIAVLFFVGGGVLVSALVCRCRRCCCRWGWYVVDVGVVFFWYDVVFIVGTVHVVIVVSVFFFPIKLIDGLVVTQAQRCQTTTTETTKIVLY